MSDDQVLDDMLGTAEEAPQGDSTDVGEGDPAEAEHAEQAGTPEEQGTEATEGEPAPPEPKFFYFDEEEVKDLPEDVLAKLAAKDRVLRNRFTQKRQQDAEAHRRAMDELRAEREKLQDRVMDLALRAIPREDAQVAQPKQELAAVARLKAAGWDEDSISAVIETAKEISGLTTAPLMEEVATVRAREQAEGALSQLRQKYQDAASLEPEMERLVANDEEVRAIVAALPSPKARAEYLYAMAKSRAPVVAAPSEEDIRKEAVRVAKEVAQKRAAAPTKGGAAQSNAGPKKDAMDEFMSGLFEKSTPYG